MPAQPRDAGPARGRARSTGGARRGLVGQQRGADGGALLRAAHVARGRGDADERLQLALGARARSAARTCPDPVVHAATQATVYGRCPSCPRWRSPPAGSTRRCAGETIESAVAPGINALKTFDPPLSALEGATIKGVRRRGKLLMLDAEPRALTLLMHLMSAGPAAAVRQARARCATAPRAAAAPVRGPRAAAARVRDQAAAWVKLLTPDASRPTSRSPPRPRGVARPARDLGELLARHAPLHSLLRDQPVMAGIGRTWVDEILHAAKLSPFKRGDDLSEEEAEALRAAMVSELGRVSTSTRSRWRSRCPRSSRSRPRIHAHQGEPCPRCETVLEAVFYEDYVMTYCPHCQTEGRVLKDRRLSRLLK